jgi:glycosyltransferase involved in cell wall biosynthesis
MKIWIAAVYEPLPAVDGEVRRLRWGLLAGALADRGHTVRLWTPSFDHVHKRQRVLEPTTVEYGAGVTAEVLPAPAYGSNISLARIRHNRAFAEGFAAAVDAAEEAPDVIVASVPTLELAEAAVRSAGARGSRVVVDVMDRWPDVYLTALPKSMWGVGRRLLATEYRRAARIFESCDAVAAVSQTFLDWALTLGGRRPDATTAVYPLSYALPEAGVAAEAERLLPELRHRWGVRDGERIAAFIGSFGRSSQVQVLLDAARRLAASGRHDIRLIIAGGGGAEPALRAAAADLGNVTFTGWLDHTASTALLMLADVGIAPYEARAQQSLPYKPFEYMAHGLPILTSLDGELRTVLEQEGIGRYFPAGDADALARLLAACADRTGEVERMGRRARDIFDERYAVGRVYGEFAAFIESAAPRAAPTRGVAC